ncbi:hypothetical protein ACWPKS_10330 [Coraliomargarita sp. W4R72]
MAARSAAAAAAAWRAQHIELIDVCLQASIDAVNFTLGDDA